MASATFPAPKTPPDPPKRKLRRMKPAYLISIPPFLTLDIKILQRIFRLIFTDAVLSFGTNPVTGREGWHVNGHPDVLFTCQSCYEEGHDIFWQEAAIYGIDQWRAKVKKERERGRHPDAATAGLGNAAQYRLRHIRGVDTTWSQPCVDLSTYVNQFPLLETCELIGRPLLVDGSPSQILDLAERRPIPVRDPGLDIDDDEGWITFALRYLFPLSSPQLYLKLHNVTATWWEVQYLMAATIMLGNDHPVAPGTLKILWINLSNATFMIKHNAKLFDEAAIEVGFRDLIVKVWKRPEEVDDKVQSSVSTDLVTGPSWRP